jgi:uncharacterized spore protein YtfJ
MFRRNKKQAETTLHTPDGIEPIDGSLVQSDGAAFGTITKLFDVYQPGVVFSEPHTIGDNTVITAAEVYVGMGIGFGSGSSSKGSESDKSNGGGGGGGGASAGRPIAAIIVTPRGVQVEPIVDVTKIALAFFTMLGAIFMAWRTMRRQR